MKKIISTLTRSLAVGLFCAAAIAMTTRSADAQATCSKWDLSGEWTFVQTNGTSPTFTLQQTPTGLQGTAIYWYEYDDSGYRLPRRASVDGTINGDAFEVTAYWDNRTTGIYTGKIGPQGRLQGSTYAKADSRNRADFYSDRIATCASQGVCSRWDMSGDWKFVQTNDSSPSFTLEQTRTGLQGSAYHGWTTKDKNLPGFKVGDGFHNNRASVNGAINGNSVEITAYWSNGTIGLYTGKIDPQGRIEGTTFDKRNPQNSARWYSDRTARCLAGTGGQIGTTSSSLTTGAEPVKPVGRIKLPKATPSSPPISICESARRARAINNPAAPGLEARCRAAGASGEKVAIKPVGRIKLPEGTPSSPPKSKCESARQAREQNNAAAPGLAQQCRAELAAKGASIVAASQNDTALASVRNAEANEFYREGFDIATAIFGDPALGAQGNTQSGPGSLGIRDSLKNAAGERGFNAAMRLHLSRNYPR